MIKEIKSEQEFNKLTTKHKVSLTQVWAWASTKTNYTLKHIAQDDFPIIIYERNIPFLKNKFAYIPRGLNEQYLENYDIGELVKYLKSANYSHIILEPNIQYNDSALKRFKEAGFKDAGKTFQPEHTRIINLTLSEDELMADMKSSTRNDIRRTFKKGMVIECDNSQQGFEDFFSIVQSIISRRNFTMQNRVYFENIYKKFKDTGLLHIVKIVKDDELLGAYMCLDFYGVSYELYGGVNESGAKQRTSILLKWGSMVEAKRRGNVSYDQWGVAPLLGDGTYDKADGQYGISEFKRKFGGEHVQYLPQLIMVCSTLSYRIFQVSLGMHRQLVKIKKRMR